MARGRPKKQNDFDVIDAEFKNAIDSMSDDDIKKRLAEVALAENENLKAKKADQDLEQKKVLAKEASEQYREATKANKAKVAYCSMVLEARGKL